jgi:hypothetical protein
MPAYRAYFLDPDDHITGTEIIEVGTLAAAINIALGMLKDLPAGRYIELWEGENRRCSLPLATYASLPGRAQSDPTGSLAG